MKGQDGLVLCQRWRWFQVRKFLLNKLKTDMSRVLWMKFLVSFWPLEAKTELTPFEEAAVRGEPETGRSLRSNWCWKLPE